MKTGHERDERKRKPNKSESRSHVKSLDNTCTQTHTDLSLLPLQGHGWWLPGCGSMTGRRGVGEAVGRDRVAGCQSRPEDIARGVKSERRRLASPDKVAEWRARTPSAQRSVRLRPITADRQRFVSECRGPASRALPWLSYLWGDAICLTSYEIKSVFLSVFCSNCVKKTRGARVLFANKPSPFLENCAQSSVDCVLLMKTMEFSLRR